MMLLCALPDSPCPWHHLCAPAVGWGLLWSHCGFCTAVRWEGPSCFSLWYELHLDFWGMEIHISLGHPSTPPKLEQLACTHPSVLSSRSWIWNIRGKWADRTEMWILGECKGCLKSCYSIIVIVIKCKLREMLWFCRAAAIQSLYSSHL